ncbi:MAG: glycosyltransferase family 4 protein [Ignavibacteriaceae bacterium]
MKKKHILIITNEGFPSGMATTNRILSLIKALTMFDHVYIRVYCVRPTESRENLLNKNTYGTIADRVSFVYTNGKLIWSQNKSKKIIDLFLGNILFICRFISDNKKFKYNYFINTTNGFAASILYKIISYIYGLRIILTIDEYPTVLRSIKKYFPIYRVLYLKYFYHNYDLMIVMTKTLVEYYKDKVSKKCKLVHIPMTVEPERFNCRINVKQEYIAYCGNLGQNQKDGVPILVKAFSQIKDCFPHLFLYIIGDTIQSEKEHISNLKELVKQLAIEERVIFTGKIHRDNMPELLCGAKVLALARPHSIQAKGGFPTKLGEYLATGNPVVVTKVGEISEYLIDRETAFLATPNSVDSFANKLREALTSPDSKRIGLAGRELCLNVFSYKIQGKILHDALERIL